MSPLSHNTHTAQAERRPAFLLMLTWEEALRRLNRKVVPR